MESSTDKKREAGYDLRVEVADVKRARTSTDDISMHEVGKESLVIDTNKPEGNVSYEKVQTTDYYRKGQPYKLFCKPGRSFMKIYFDLGDISDICKVDLTLNHCRTNCHAIIDISLNDKSYVDNYKEARWDNFGRQTFNLPKELLQSGKNIIIIMLNRDSPGVYWLSDLRFDIERLIH